MGAGVMLSYSANRLTALSVVEGSAHSADIYLRELKPDLRIGVKYEQSVSPPFVARVSEV
jgi:hypothetical protein